MNETGLTDPVTDPVELPNKMGCFDLSVDTNGKLTEINSDFADYVNKHIKTFVSNQTLKEGISSANSILSNITGDFL